MAYVYVITNILNGKQYVGVTEGSLKERYRLHLKDCKTDRCKNRPLYYDMNKYGAENFSIEELEECNNKDKFDRECYWINKLDTYKNGYNLTYGGSGKQFYNHKEIADKYLELGKMSDVCDFYNCDIHTVRSACKKYGINITSSQEINKSCNSKSVVMLDYNNGKKLHIFNSLTEAALYLEDKDKLRHISEVCNGTRKSAYGYKWMWLEDYEKYQQYLQTIYRKEL